MKVLVLFVLLLSSCAHGPIRKAYTPYEPPIIVKKQKKKKTLVADSFCSDGLTAIHIKDNPIESVKNSAPKTFETFITTKKCLLFVNLKRGKTSKGHNIITVVLKSGEAFFLREKDCHGVDIKITIDKLAEK